MPRYDLKKYSGQRFIRPDHVREEPLRDTIVGVQEGKFGNLLARASADLPSQNFRSSFGP